MGLLTSRDATEPLDVPVYRPGLLRRVHHCEVCDTDVFLVTVDARMVVGGVTLCGLGVDFPTCNPRGATCANGHPVRTELLIDSGLPRLDVRG